MKKFITFLFIILTFSFFGCDLILNNMNNQLGNIIDDYSIDFEVFGFGEDSAVLKWSTSTSGTKFRIYEKSNGKTIILEENYAGSTYFAKNNEDSFYAIGLILNNSEVYKTNFVKPDWDKGFPVWTMISDDDILGITFPFVQNVEYYSLEGKKENGQHYYTDYYSETDLEDSFIHLKCDENSENNWFILIFTIDNTDYVSEKYYFDYDDYLEAFHTDYIELFPKLEIGNDEIEDDLGSEDPDVTIDFTVQAFNEESVVLQWSTDLSNVRYNIYVKDKDDEIERVKKNYGKTNYFVVSDDQSSYAIGVLIDDEEVYRTKYIYPELENEKGFPVYAEISDDGYLGVECLYPSNVDLFYLKGVHENGKTYHTTKYSAEELNHYLLPIRYEKNSRNNYFTLIFTIGGTEYISAPYYFDYAHHLEAVEAGEGNSITLYPSL